MKTSLPGFVKKYFWGDDLSKLSWEKHRDYISKIILEKGDQKAVAWLLRRVNRQELKEQLPTFKLDSKSDNFWNLYL